MKRIGAILGLLAVSCGSNNVEYPPSRPLDSVELATAEIVQDIWNDMYEPGGSNCGPKKVRIRYLPKAELLETCPGCCATESSHTYCQENNPDITIAFFRDERVSPDDKTPKPVITILDSVSPEALPGLVAHQYLHYLSTCSDIASEPWTNEYMHNDFRRYICSVERQASGQCTKERAVIYHFNNHPALDILTTRYTTR